MSFGSTSFAGTPFSALEVTGATTNASIAATDAADLAAITADTITSGVVAAVESSDTVAITGSATVGAAIAATDNTDAAAITATVPETNRLIDVNGSPVFRIGATTAGLSVDGDTVFDLPPAIVATLAAAETADTAAVTGDASGATTSASIAAAESADVAAITGNANLGTTEAVIVAVESVDVASIFVGATTSAQLLAIDASDAIVIMAVGDVVTGTISTSDATDATAISTAMPTGSAPPTTRILRPRRRRLGSDAYGVPPAG